MQNDNSKFKKEIANILNLLLGLKDILHFDLSFCGLIFNHKAHKVTKGNRYKNKT